MFGSACFYEVSEAFRDYRVFDMFVAKLIIHFIDAKQGNWVYAGEGGILNQTDPPNDGYYLSFAQNVRKPCFP